MRGEKSVVITGASTGIGYATAAFLAARKWQVFAGVRKDEDAKRLRDTLGARVTPLIMDVTKAETLHTAAAAVREGLGERTLSGLVNNAGVAMAGPLLHLNPQEMTDQLDINLTGAKARGFNISANLLEVAREVR